MVLVQRQGRTTWWSKKIIAVPNGLQANLLHALADQGGFLGKSEALKLLRRNYSAGDVDALMKKIKPEISNLRKLIRSAIGQATEDNPLPYDKTRFGWLAKIQIGFAVQEDRQHVGGEHRLRFKTRNELTSCESADQ